MLAAVQGSSTSFRGFSLFELELLARITSVFRCEKNQKVRPAHPTQLYHRRAQSLIPRPCDEVRSIRLPAAASVGD
jgi:hypothetical protein